MKYSRGEFSARRAVMNGRQRRAVNIGRTNSQPPTQCFGLIVFVFAAFLLWLWLYSPEAQDGGGASPIQSPASAEVQEWLNSNGLRALEMDSRIVGEFGR